jgi:aspartate/methionine/tyrosine aminotransferase
MAETLQEFFDRPAVMAARHKLSASAAEPVPLEELLALEDGAAERFQRGALDYPERYGPSALRDAIAAKYATVGEAGVEITSGLDEALGLIFTTLIAPGDRVIVLSPCYPPQRLLPAWRGGQVVEWWVRPEQDFVPDLDELRALLRQPARAVITTFPMNPTGFFPDPDFIDALVAVLREAGTILISDEIDGGLPADGPPALNLADRYEHAVSLHGLSKTCGLPGLRFGWMATGDPDLHARLREAKNLFNAYVPGPIAVLADLALRHEAALVARADAVRAECLALAEAFFARHGNLFAWQAPEAGVLAFPEWLGPGSSRDLSERLVREASISLAPSTCFGAGDAHVRIGLTRREFGDGLAAFDRFLAGL